ncbi:hypothetical protein SAMN05421780_108170 [Flexibacter flexilis DSM 6793]|uniref:Uncharacterized protein n=1 Tax=Flexibacter flexilis DSM 6793 TaxID=927664 RepID=A0A1I1LCQ7_9BACT|nr:hypothetical protein [Flexibacter flexilis]SFC70809.1 hypothetical protein SAMN05421780_108170 [Flexibacter flexilis DSM 6793]
MDAEKIKEEYKGLKRNGKTGLTNDFCQRFNYKDGESLRARLRGDLEFLTVHIEYLAKTIPLYKPANQNEIVADGSTK